MLEYENEMFLSSMQEDGLTIAAKGLSLEKVILNMLKVYCDPGNLVLMLGCSDTEEQYFRGELEKDGCTFPPKKITTDVSTGERERVYREGGVLYITTRILVVDMLMERIPISLITGIIVTKAHRIMDSAQDSFILRLYRQKNKEGFIKAFSASPVSFSAGFCQVERVMKNLFIRHLHLWPRFQKTIATSLEVAQPEVVELHLQLTTKMKEIQTAVLEIISFTVKEVKRLNPHLLTEVLTVENTISKSFHKILQQELNPIWHQLSGKTRQLIQDLKTLRNLLVYLTQYDCITFYNLIAALRTAERAINSSSGWVLLDSAETLFLASKERVFASIEPSKPKQAKTENKKEPSDIEENPKWTIVSEILDEIKAEVKEYATDGSKDTVLIITKDDRTAGQVQDYLEIGAKTLLNRMFNKVLGEKYGRREEDKKREVKNKGQGKNTTAPPVKNNTVRIVGEDSISGENKESEINLVIRGLDSGSYLENRALLHDIKPRFVLLYDSDVTFVRQIEVYQANNPNLKTRVYFLMYKGSVEEQAYLTVIRREKEAFEKLIKDKSTMVIPEDREGKTIDNDQLSRDPQKPSQILLESQNITSRKGGLNKPLVQSKVIVDMREFRSELPSLLHKRGIDIDPITLEVGDYILTPEICVERKSVSDLIGSLNNGRLYNQATSMSRFYERPMLLIEFDDKGSFSFQGKYYLSKDIQYSDIMAKLQLLTIHFPKLRILWSPSPHATAELFYELKQGRDQPDPKTAATLGVDIIDDFNSDKYNPQVRDLLAKLPGITTKNIFCILNNCENLLDLVQYAEEDLAKILGSHQAAHQLYTALHDKIEVPETSSNQNKQNKKPVFKSRFKSKKKT